MFTVVIPTHNRASLLRRALESVAKQTIKARVIIVDDASDEHIELAWRDLGLDIEIIRTKSRVGAQVARLLGVSAARSRFVALLDSDDWWSPEKLEAQLAALERQPRSLIASRLIAVAGSRSKVVPDRVYHRSETVESFLYLRDGVLQTSTFAAEVDVMRRLLVDTSSTTVHNDTAMALRARELGYDIVQLDAALSFFDDSHRSDRITLDGKRIERSLVWFAEVGQSWRPEVRSAFMIKDTAMRLLKAGQRRRAALTVIQNLHWRTLRHALRTTAFIACNGSPKRLIGGVLS